MNRKKKHGYIEKGKIDFDFDIEKEIITYKEILGYRLSRREQKYKKEHMEVKEKFENYMDWKNNIKKKYRKYSEENLKSFIFYLNQGEHKSLKSVQNMLQIVVSFYIGIGTFYIEEYFRECMELDRYGNVIFLVGMLIISVTVIRKAWQLLSPDCDREIVYKVYREVIEELCRENFSQNLERTYRNPIYEQ